MLESSLYCSVFCSNFCWVHQCWAKKCKGYYISTSYSLTEFRNKLMFSGVVIYASIYLRLTNCNIFSYFEYNKFVDVSTFISSVCQCIFRLHKLTQRYNVLSIRKIQFDKYCYLACVGIFLCCSVLMKNSKRTNKKRKKRKRLQIVENLKRIKYKRRLRTQAQEVYSSTVEFCWRRFSSVKTAFHFRLASIGFPSASESLGELLHFCH